jgi:hypothetical protein
MRRGEMPEPTRLVTAADLREVNRQLLDLVADLADENRRLRQVHHQLLVVLDQPHAIDAVPS